MQIRCAAVIVSTGLFVDKIEAKGDAGGEKVTTLDGLASEVRSPKACPESSEGSDLPGRVGNVVAAFDLLSPLGFLCALCRFA